MIQHLLRLMATTSHSILDAFAQPVIRKPIAIGLGAIAGALTRYYLTVWFASRFDVGFPHGTFWINLTGCFMMGFFATFAEQVALITPELRLMIAVGFLGSYTTFSTYELDTRNLFRDGHSLIAIFYWCCSAVLGVISLQIGIILARFLTR